MATINKPTKRDHFNALLAIPAVAENPTLVTFINHEIELLAKKNSSERKPTKTQTANMELSAQILSMMNVNQIYTATEIQKMLGIEQYTLPKVTALLRSMLTVTIQGEVNPNGTIERFMEKGRAYFRKLDLPMENDEMEED